MPNKRYYKRLSRFPDNIDRLETEARHPITEDQIAGWLDKYFMEGNLKPTVGYMILKYGLWEEAMNLGLDGAQPKAFRATWALEWAYEQSEERPAWFFDRMVEDFLRSDNGSLHRVYAKMIADQIAYGEQRPTPAKSEQLAEKCFDLLIGEKTRVAVKFWCMEILYELTPDVEWIREALEETARRISEEPDCTAGMAVACREILRSLNR